MTEKERIDHLTRENVLAAINRIDEEGFPGARTSSTYDLVFDGKVYPPKYVTSLAGYFSDRGQFIFGKLFSGGDDSACFAKLRELGFELLPKEQTADLKEPESVRDIHYKYCYQVIDEQLDKEGCDRLFKDYIAYCDTSNWMQIHESYKFKFGRWLTERIDFDRQSDEEIYKICLESQEQEYSENFKGVNFVLSVKRYEDDFITLGDVALLRKLREGKLLEEFDLKDSPMSFAKFGVWAGCLIPEKYGILANGDLFDGLDHLFHFEDAPKKGVRYFNLYNTALNELKAYLKSNYQQEAKHLISKGVEVDELLPVDWVWLAQDFLLYIIRRAFRKEKNYFWVFQGDSYGMERDNGIVAAPVDNLHHHKRLREMIEGDVVVHYANSAVRAISTVKREFVIADKPYLRDKKDNYIVEVEYQELDNPISMESIKEKFEKQREALPKKYGPLSKDLGPVQMYMCAFTKEGYDVLFDNSNYWVFQGRPEIFDAVKAIQEKNLESWSVHAHKSKIKVGDKIILWLTGEKSGCYALAEVTSELFHSPELSNEKKYYAKAPGNDVTSDKVKIKITKDLTSQPVLKEELLSQKEFLGFKGGNQGTNFTATKEQYDKILSMSNQDNTDINYWVYSPGENAKYWDVFYDEGIMGLGWNELGDISRFNSKEEIVRELQRIEKTDSSKKNDATANWEFLNRIKAGDVVIVKRGRRQLLGYGEVASDYYFDDSRNDQTHLRKVNWKLKGEWSITHSLSLKTLTRITDYESELPEYDFYYQRLLAEMGVGIKKKERNMKAVNQILYGPPGTGKTYTLKSDFFERYTSRESSITIEQYIEDIAKDMTWWQVITLALIESGTSKVSDLVENRWVVQKANLSESKNVRATIWGTLQMHTIQESETVAYSQRQPPLIFDKNKDKTWSLIETEAKEQCPELYIISDHVLNYKPTSDKEIKRYVFTTFHQSYSYEDFIEGIKPVISEDESAGSIGYRIENGVFKDLCLRAANDPENRYAIFIDEINRGNVSAIFGELITLIEQDKRKGAENAMQAILPYSKKPFSVPANVDIYGTMNTADRSVEALDTALRRRFTFQERMPDTSLLEGKKVGGVDLKPLLDTINERIESLIDRDHTIGHAYLINVKSLQDLRVAFKDKIVPLLQEYFYGDYGKIGLVLGEGFVEVEMKGDDIFSSFPYEGREGLSQTAYTLKSFEDIDFEEAIKQLFGN